MSYATKNRYYMKKYDVGDDDANSDDDDVHVHVDVAADTSESLFTSSFI